MLLTNDVTLVTLVPFAVNVLKAYKDRRRTMFTLILMTVSANLGSMLTPIGNPQNLYLYTNYHIALPDFIMLMLPYSAVSLLLLIVSVFILNVTDKTLDTAVTKKADAPKPLLLGVYSILFIVCLLTVSGILHYLIMQRMICTPFFAFFQFSCKLVRCGIIHFHPPKEQQGEGIRLLPAISYTSKIIGRIIGLRLIFSKMKR